LDRARRLIISPRRLEVSLVEHQAIFKAIAAGDAIAASAAMRSHIDSVMLELLDFARHRPEFFADGRSLNENDLSDVFQYG
jgi:DNA-binding GntR family transcriptional regulator